MEHYPFDEGKAGSLRDEHETAAAADYLKAGNEIITLAKKVLTAAQYQEAELTATQLAGNNAEKKTARARLMHLVHPPPKRPIYYAQYEIEHLPRWTRNVLRFLGDYVDMMVKAATYEKTNDKKIFNNSFGPAITMFKGSWPSETALAANLENYNRFLYRPAKHDFKLPAGRTHRFTAREVVLSAYISMQFGDILSNLSPTAMGVKLDKAVI